MQISQSQSTESAFATATAATTWEEGLIVGSGRVGAVLSGQPDAITITFAHERYFLPLNARPDAPDLTSALGEIRGALLAGDDGIQLWSTETRPDVALPWSTIRSVDVDPGLNPGARSRPSILIYTTVSPRIAIRLLPQGPYGVLRPNVEKVGEIVARLRELQPSPSA